MVENKVLENVCSFRKGIDEIIIKNSSDESLKDSIINILEDNNEIFNTECKLTSKINGSIVIKDIINLVTHKYNNDLVR